MLALVVSLMMTAFDPSVLTIPKELMVIPPDPIEVRKDVWIDALIDCESGGNEKIKVLDTNGYYSYGLLQFQLSTWLNYGKDFGATKENIYDGELQRKVARKMLDDGGANHWWTCSRAVGKVYGVFQ